MKYLAIILYHLGFPPASCGVVTPMGLDVYSCGYFRKGDGTFHLPLPKHLYLENRNGYY